MFRQNPFGRDQQNKSQDGTEAPKEVRFQHSAPATQQPSFGNTPGEFRAFGSPATFVTPSTIAPYTGSQFVEIPSNFGLRPSQKTFSVAVFGSAFQSPSMASVASGTPTTSQQQQPPDSPPVSYSFTAAASRLTTSAYQQPPSWTASFGQQSGFVQSSAPIFPAGFGSGVNLGTGASVTMTPMPSSTSGTGPLGQKFGQTAPTSTVTPVAETSPRREQKLPDAEMGTSSKIEGSQQQTKMERTERSSRVGDKRKSVQRQEQVRKPVIQRKGALFYRALAGVTKNERSRVRLPSTDDPYQEPRPRHPSENSGIGSSRSNTTGQSIEVTRVSPEEIVRLKSIICKGVPNDLNNKQTLKEHFSKFGEVTRIYCSPQKESAIIHFLDHASAALAKLSGTVIRPGMEPVLILWSKVVSSTRPKSQPTTPTVIPDIRQESSRSSKKYLDQSEINAELQAMGQAQSLDAPKILARPKDRPKKGKKKLDVLKLPDSMEELLKMSAHTTEERYRFLDARDKFLRLGVKKQSDLATARATIGTCPDMCPEKERYMRAHRSQLHPYEMGRDGNSVDHTKAVKEYSRSSADQEEPLSHELRPASVLSMTMDYLICYVMDRHENGQSSTEEWYDFVWNRTRALRKDITQQHLCNVVAVSVVERCARFHIHCAERLCEEHMATFDQKINNENLTNCLQTLKHFYEDLEVKGERCCNEAEFRAYDVLLNLNEGDILRQVQLLDLSVRESPAVTQALGFYAALNSNNYVRFFKLVRSTSYLNACIVQRYFTQVRLKTLLTILKAYSPPNRSGMFPISKLVDILAFEDELDARDFLEHYCVAVENGYVVLDRSTFYQPENAAPLKRSLKIIESKRACLIGEVINGGPLPPNPLHYHVPHSSFNHHGVLCKETTTETKMETTTKQDSGSPQAAVVTIPPIRNDSPQARVAAAEDQRARCLDELAASVTDALIAETVLSLAHNTSTNELGAFRLWRRWTLETATIILDDACSASMREVAAKVHKEEKLEELKARRRQEEAELERQRHVAQLKEECISEMVDEVLHQVVKMELQAIAAQHFKMEKEAARQRHFDQISQLLSEDFCQIWVDEGLHHLCALVHAEQLELRKQIFKRVSWKLGVWRSAVFFHKWLKYVAKRKHMRHSMELFPSCSLGLRSKGTMGQPWVGAKSTGLMSPIQVAENRKCIDKHLDMNFLSCHIRNSFSDLYIDLLSLAKDFVPYAQSLIQGGGRFLSHPLQNLYWKVLLSLSNISQDHTGQLQILVQWLQRKLNQPLSRWCWGSSKMEVFKMTIEDDGHSCFPYASAICYRALQGECQLDDPHSYGTQGILYVMQLSEDIKDPGFWMQERTRLLSVLRSKPYYPPLPVLIAVLVSVPRSPGDLFTRRIEVALGLRDLLDNGSISEFSIIPFRDDLSEPSSTENLLHCLQWLAQHCLEPPKLHIQSFDHFLNLEADKYFSALGYQDLALTAELGCSHQLPDVLIDAYNHSLDNAAATVSDETLKNISWPPVEFAEKYSDLPSVNWNTDETFRQLRSLVASYHLPPFPTDVKKCVVWQDIVEAIWSYMDLADHADGWASKIVLASRIQKILDRSREQYRGVGFEPAPYEVIGWTDLIHAFIDHNLQTAPMDLHVVYDLEMAQSSFEPSKEWKQAGIPGKWSNHTPLPRLSVSRTVLDASAKTAKRKKEFVGNETRSALKRRADQDPFRNPSEEEELKKSCSELMRQLRIEKQRAIEFEQLLRRELEDEVLIQESFSTSF